MDVDSVDSRGEAVDVHNNFYPARVFCCCERGIAYHLAARIFQLNSRSISG